MDFKVGDVVVLLPNIYSYADLFGATFTITSLRTGHKSVADYAHLSKRLPNYNSMGEHSAFLTDLAHLTPTLAVEIELERL